MFRLICIFILMLNLCSCAVLHSTQITSIDSNTVRNGKRFEVLVSETGFNVNEAIELSKNLTRNKKTQEKMEEIQNIIALFQMGPVTGKMVYNDKFPDEIPRLIMSKCPSGHISGLMSIRETASYPVVSGEIIKIIGYCQI